MFRFHDRIDPHPHSHHHPHSIHLLLIHPLNINSLFQFQFQLIWVFFIERACFGSMRTQQNSSDLFLSYYDILLIFVIKTNIKKTRCDQVEKKIMTV